MKEEFLIEKGKLQEIKIGFLTYQRIIYAGMPTEKAFAISTIIDTDGEYTSHQIFYPKETTFITIIKQRFKVIEVTPDYIILALEKQQQ